MSEDIWDQAHQAAETIYNESRDSGEYSMGGHEWFGLMVTSALHKVLGLTLDTSGPERDDPSYQAYTDIEMEIEDYISSGIMHGIASAIVNVSERYDIAGISASAQSDITRHKEEEAAREAAMTPEEREEQHRKFESLLAAFGSANAPGQGS